MNSSGERTLLRNSGFSLIEVMVVVAIIAILARMGVSSYNRRQAVAYQSEAKSSLSFIYIAERASLIEQFSFTGCLAKIGVKPENQLRRYSFGFYNPTNLNCGPFNGPHNQSCVIYNFSNGRSCTNVDNSTFFLANTFSRSDHFTPTAADMTGSFINYNYFIAIAAGNVSSSTRALDIWSIDSSKTLVNIDSQL